MRPLGLGLLSIALAIPLYWYWPLAMTKDPIAVFSHYLGSAALIAMGISQLLATRLKGLETIFGGLDRIYVLHKWIGIGAMAAILLHDTIDAELREDTETVLTELGETFGEISLYGLLILVVITVLTFVPYHWWRWTHRFMGGFFTLAALHFLLIMKPFALTDPLGLYIAAFCVIGILAYIYTLIPYRRAGHSSAYQVENLEQTGGALAVTLSPLNRGFKPKPGQFAFLSFDLPGLEESHPFTISRAPDDRRHIRFTIGQLGDYTTDLKRALKIGDQARVIGPYGHFLRTKRGKQIWIAGGIGVTPFVAWAQSLQDDEGPVHLFYAVKRRDAAPHLEELERLAAEKSGLTLHLVESKSQGRLRAEQIAETMGSISSTTVAFCGPATMRESLRQGLKAYGLQRLRYEEFEIRSGIGLQEMLVFIFDKLMARLSAGPSQRQS